MRTRITATLVSLSLLLAASACTGSDSQDVEPTISTAAAIADPGPPRDPCQGAMDEAIELIAQLVAYADSQSLDELRTVGTDEFLQEMNTSIDQLHSQFGDSCAHRQYERTLYEAVADLEAETEAGVAMLEMFSDCNLWRW